MRGRRVISTIVLHPRTTGKSKENGVLFHFSIIIVRCVLVSALAVLLYSLVILLQLDSNPTQAEWIDKTTTTALSSIPGHDPYSLIHNAPKLQITNTTCSVPPGTGEEGPAGVRALYKIYLYWKNNKVGQEDRIDNDSAQQQRSTQTRKTRLLCMVYTHSNRHDVIHSIAETYGPQCDGFLAASNITDASIGAFDIPHDGPEAYRNMWNKVQYMWQYVHDHYLHQFDWFLICGDDTYVLPDNVRTVAAYYEEQETKGKQRRTDIKMTMAVSPPPLYLGASIPHSNNPTRRYCGGGAGYMLNQPALSLLIRRMQLGECPDAVAPDEDIRIARCLDDAGIRCHDTNDAEHEEVRFHHLDAQFHASWTPARSSLWLWPKLQYFHNIRGNQSKLEQISTTSTTFHLDKSKVRSHEPDRGIRRYHAILHPEVVCGHGFADQVREAATCDAERQAELRREWSKVDIPGARKKKN